MFTPWVLIPGANGDSYGYGWQIKYGKHLLMYHDGGNPGFNAYNGRFPDDKVAVIVFGNNEGEHTDLVTTIDLMTLGTY